MKRWVWFIGVAIIGAMVVSPSNANPSGSITERRHLAATYEGADRHVFFYGTDSTAFGAEGWSEGCIAIYYSSGLAEYGCGPVMIAFDPGASSGTATGSLDTDIVEEASGDYVRESSVELDVVVTADRFGPPKATAYPWAETAPSCNYETIQPSAGGWAWAETWRDGRSESRFVSSVYGISQGSGWGYLALWYDIGASIQSPVEVPLVIDRPRGC